MKFDYLEMLTGLPADVRRNIRDLLARVNQIPYAPSMNVSSGYRDPEHNKKIGGAPNSAHVQGKAIDIADPGQKLSSYLMKNEPLLAKLGLRMEHPSKTLSWCHLDSNPVPAGGKRIFMP